MHKEKATIPLVHIEEIIPILNEISIFGGLTDNQLYEVFRVLKEVNYNAKEIIYEKGDLPSHIYIVWSGKVESYLMKDNDFLAKTMYTVGECFGETSVLGIEPHVTTSIAVEPTRLIVLEKSSLMSLMQKDKDLFLMLILNINRETCRRLHKTDEILLDFYIRNCKHSVVAEDKPLGDLMTDRRHLVVKREPGQNN